MPTRFLSEEFLMFSKIDESIFVNYMMQNLKSPQFTSINILTTMKSPFYKENKKWVMEFEKAKPKIGENFKAGNLERDNQETMLLEAFINRDFL